MVADSMIIESAMPLIGQIWISLQATRTSLGYLYGMTMVRCPIFHIGASLSDTDE